MVDSTSLEELASRIRGFLEGLTEKEIRHLTRGKFTKTIGADPLDIALEHRRESARILYHEFKQPYKKIYELLREEARYGWFLRNAVEVVEALRGVNYALYKFRRPVEHVSVDLDLLIRVEDVPRAVKALAAGGFKVAIFEPYTVTLERRSS